MLKFGAPPGFFGSSAYSPAGSADFSTAEKRFERTIAAAATDGKRCILSAWTKMDALAAAGVYQGIMGADGGNESFFAYEGTGSADKVNLSPDGSGASLWLTADSYDSTVWRHLLWSLDTTQTTATDRYKLYVNGTLYPGSWTTQNTIAQNSTVFFTTNTYPVTAGGLPGGLASQGMAGLLADPLVIDGYSIQNGDYAISNFIDALGKPVNPALITNWGTNGWWLDFRDGTSETTMGYDRSGNGNNFTPTGTGTITKSSDVPT